MIIVQGTVGVGKTTICQKLAVREQLQLFPEPVEENPFLGLYYENPKRYAYSMQTFLVHSRFKQMLEAQKLGKQSVMDMSIYGNDIFSKVMCDNGDMTIDEYKTYLDISDTYKSLIESPSLMVYLQCSTQTSVERIMKRNRPSELKASLLYWYQLNEAYEQWYEKYSASKKILINVDYLNVVHEESDEDYLIDCIIDALNH